MEALVNNVLKHNVDEQSMRDEHGQPYKLGTFPLKRMFNVDEMGADCTKGQTKKIASVKIEVKQNFVPKLSEYLVHVKYYLFSCTKHQRL